MDDLRESQPSMHMEAFSRITSLGHADMCILVETDLLWALLRHCEPLQVAPSVRCCGGRWIQGQEED